MSGPCILVVDDDASIRLLCRVNLELEGHRVLEAPTLDEARRLLADEPVAAVLLDMHVGTQNGRELLVELRERNGPPVALLTGSADPTQVRPAPDAVIPKPFTLEQLHDAVETLLSLRVRVDSR